MVLSQIGDDAHHFDILLEQKRLPVVGMYTPEPENA